MIYLKAFIAGLVLPATITPIVILIAVLLGKDQILSVASLHALPLIWGVWNILYFEWFRSLLPGYMDLRLLINGAALGLLLALYGVFFLHLPALWGLRNSVSTLFC